MWKKNLQTQVDLDCEAAEPRRWRLLLAPVMCSLFLFELAWLNAWQFAVRQVNLTAQWNASHSWEQNVGSFLKRNKRKKESTCPQTLTASCTQTGVSFSQHTWIFMDKQATSPTSPLDSDKQNKNKKKLPGLSVSSSYVVWRTGVCSPHGAAGERNRIRSDAVSIKLCTAAQREGIDCLSVWKLVELLCQRKLLCEIFIYAPVSFGELHQNNFLTNNSLHAVTHFSGLLPSFP